MGNESADLYVNVKGTGWETLTSNANKATNGLKNMNTGSNKLSSGLNSLAMRFVGLQAVVTMGMQKFRELHQWIGASIEKFREFENRIAEVSTILQGTSMNLLPALQTGVEQLSIKFGKAANDITEGLYDILSAAFDADDSIRLLNTSIKASIAGLTDVSTSVDVFTSILNAYGKTVAQAAGISDILFQTVVRGKLRFEDLASAMGYITPIAANAGVAFEEVAAVLATVTRQGLHVDMASRGLALMIQGIVSPAQAASVAAQKFGVNLSGLALRVKGLEGFITDLNEATEEYGMGILPQIVRNMRSLRVAMALAGDEGIAGFTEDLQLMRSATGKTEEALTKMMNTEQRQAEILAQSFELVERKIGEAWSGVDIWWRKAKLWWATGLAGGDADKAVREVEAGILKVRKASVELLSQQSRLGAKEPLMQTLLGDPTKTGALFTQLAELSKVREFLDASDQSEAFATQSSNLGLLTEKLTIYNDELKIQIDRTDAVRNKTPGRRIENIRAEYVLTANELSNLNKIMKEHSLPVLELGITYGDITDIISEFNAQYEEVGENLIDANKAMDAAQPGFDFFKSFFDDMSESINNHKQNLLELKNAISILNEELVDTYTTIGGDTFKGKLRWELEVKTDEASLSRFEEFSTMALKYGAEYFNEYTDKTDEFGNSLEEVVLTMHNYTEVQEEMAKNQKELNDLLDENLLLIRKNNLEKMKLQLIGMVRRRGNTRTEMKMMKQLDIENLKLRIENMGKEVEAEEAVQEAKGDITETAYDRAKEILERYMDTERHNLFVLKDIRDDEIRDLNESITYKEGILSDYTTWYGEELTALQTENQVYMDSLKALSETAPDIYSELFDTTYIDKWLEAYNKFAESIGETPTATTPTTPTSTEEPAPEVIDRLLGLSPFNPSSSRFPKLHNGIDSIPYEGLYHLDKGESVVPANQSGGSSTVNNISINVNAKVASDYDVERIAEVMGESIGRKLSNKNGKSKYRLR